MQRSLPRVAFWLLPEVDASLRFRQVMADLSRRFAAPVFQPHVTLYSCCRTPEQVELALLARLAEQTAPITLQPQTVATRDSLAQTLFLSFAEDEALTTLHQSLHNGVCLASDYTLDPHLSLLYQKLPASDRAALVAQQRIPFTPVRFDALGAIAIPEKLSRIEDFSDWEPLLTVRLRG